METAIAIIKAELLDLDASINYWMNETLTSKPNSRKRREAQLAWDNATIRFCALKDILNRLEQSGQQPVSSHA